jgi:hypothetical protein
MPSSQVGSAPVLVLVVTGSALVVASDVGSLAVSVADAAVAEPAVVLVLVLPDIVSSTMSVAESGKMLLVVVPGSVPLAVCWGDEQPANRLSAQRACAERRVKMLVRVVMGCRFSGEVTSREGHTRGSCHSPL